MLELTQFYYKLFKYEANMSKNNRLYNYLINTLGLSKELILKNIDQRIEQVLHKILYNELKSIKFERIIIDTVASVIDKGVVRNNRYGSLRYKFNDLIKSKVKEVVEDKLQEECQIKFIYRPNSIRFIEDKE